MPPKPPHHAPFGAIRPDQEHLKEKKQDLWNLVISIVIGTVLALGFGFFLYILKIKTDVILPVLAPIWIGAITITLSLLRKQK